MQRSVLTTRNQLIDYRPEIKHVKEAETVGC